ncbi:PAS domain S-box protein [Planctomycetota bacterium]
MEFSRDVWLSVIERAPASILIVDREHRIQAINRTVPGMKKEEVIGRSQLDCVAPEHRDLVRAVSERVLSSGAEESYEIQGADPDGQTVWYSTTVQPLEVKGEIVGLVLHASVITDKKRVEEALDLSDSRFRSLMENVPGMIYRGNPDWSIDIMKGCEKLSGYTPAEVVEKEGNWLSVIHPADREGVAAEGAAIRERSRSLMQTYRIVTQAGDTRWVEDRKTSLFDDDGRFAGVEGILLDVTDRVRAEEQLRRATAELIEQQKLAIQELSTPVIQVWDKILVLPLIGTVDTVRAKQLIEHLLEEIARRQPEVVIIDITGVPVVDTTVARSLTSTVQAARMLGAECVVTGVNPEIAQTLIRAGVSLTGIKTKGRLQNGLSFAFEATGQRVTAR